MGKLVCSSILTLLEFVSAFKLCLCYFIYLGLSNTNQESVCKYSKSKHKGKSYQASLHLRVEEEGKLKSSAKCFCIPGKQQQKKIKKRGGGRRRSKAKQHHKLSLHSQEE